MMGRTLGRIGGSILPFLISLTLAFGWGGLIAPLLAVEQDGSAPWADEVRTFVIAVAAALVAATVLAALFGLRYYLRGRREYLFGVSIGVLMLPALLSISYRWYLFEVAEGTIGGAVGFWIAAFSLALALLAMAEDALALGPRLKKTILRHT